MPATLRWVAVGIVLAANARGLNAAARAIPADAAVSRRMSFIIESKFHPWRKSAVGLLVVSDSAKHHSRRAFGRKGMGQSTRKEKKGAARKNLVVPPPPRSIRLR